MQEQAIWAPGTPVGQPAITDGANQDWFSYPLSFLDLTALGTQTQQIQIDASADFFLSQIESFSLVHGVTTPIITQQGNQPLVTILINDSGSNRNLMQGGVPLPSVSGGGQWPHYLRHPRKFSRNSAISITLVSLDATNAFDIYLNFEGFKTYNVG